MMQPTDHQKQIAEQQRQDRLGAAISALHRCIQMDYREPSIERARLEAFKHMLQSMIYRGRRS